MMMMIYYNNDDVVTFNAQVAKLCVARWKPWSWTCAFCPTKHSVVWCSDTSWTSARANGWVCPKYYFGGTPGTPILGNPHFACSEADMLKGMFNSSGFYARSSEQISTNDNTYYMYLFVQCWFEEICRICHFSRCCLGIMFKRPTFCIFWCCQTSVTRPAKQPTSIARRRFHGPSRTPSQLWAMHGETTLRTSWCVATSAMTSIHGMLAPPGLWVA